VKLWEALKFSNERKAQLHTDDGFPIIATDAGIESFVPRSDGSCVTDCVMETWSNMEPKVRKALMSCERWEPVDPKPPLVVLAEAANHWDHEDHERTTSERDRGSGRA